MRVSYGQDKGISYCTTTFFSVSFDQKLVSVISSMCHSSRKRERKKWDGNHSLGKTMMKHMTIFYNQNIQQRTENVPNQL